MLFVHHTHIQRHTPSRAGAQEAGLDAARMHPPIVAWTWLLMKPFMSSAADGGADGIG
jgi:hypothetical protein